ncbi:MAG: hypothetical protein ACOYM2_19235 [Rectinemataceae bacterium]
MTALVRIEYYRKSIIRKIRKIEKYSASQILYLLACSIITSIRYSPARLIRFPFDVRNRKMIRWGIGFTTGKNCRLEALEYSSKVPTLLIGNNVQINDNVHIAALRQVRIGDNVLIASKVFISDCSHGEYGQVDGSSPYMPPAMRGLVSEDVLIEDNVWLGDNVVVLPGATIGYGSIIGSSAVVTGNIPPMTIAVGIPAKVIKFYNEVAKKWEKKL